MSGDCDAGCIRGLPPDEANEKFAFARAADLAVRYPSVPVTPEMLECHRGVLSRLRP